MTEQQHLRWDDAENAVRDADQRLASLLSALPDDTKHHAARNRIVAAMVALEDATMYVQRARTLADAADIPNTEN